MPLIPDSIARDYATIKLMSQWGMLLQRHAQCLKRVNPYAKKAKSREAARRAERWRIDARLRSIESEVLRWIGDVTRHPDLWTAWEAQSDNPLDPQTYSIYQQLIRRYTMARRIPSANHPLRNTERQTRTSTKRAIVQQIHDLEWKWLSALYAATHPESPMPPRRPRDTRTLYPTKERKAAALAGRG